MNARLDREAAEEEEAEFLARIEARADVMAPLLTTLGTAQADFDSVSETYNDAAAIVAGGSKDANGDLEPESDQTEEWKTAKGTVDEMDTADAVGKAETAL